MIAPMGARASTPRTHTQSSTSTSVHRSKPKSSTNSSPGTTVRSAIVTATAAMCVDLATV